MPDQAKLRNHILNRLPPEEFAAIEPHLEHVELPREAVLARADQRIEHSFFLEAGLGSIIAETQDVKGEIGVIGRDGMSDISAVLGTQQSPFTSFMQIGGDAWRLPAETLTELSRTRTGIRAPLLRYVKSAYVQTAYTALANGTHTVEERLARWLLMSNDRADDARVPLTHEFLSLMLAVRRPSVTVALHVLEGERWIRSTRGLITIIDREGLEGFAGDIYTKPAVEIERLMAA